MPVNKVLAALQKVAAALEPLKPEERRQVIEAVHTILEIDPGCDEECGPGAGPMGGYDQGWGMPGQGPKDPPAKPAKSGARRKG